MEIVVAIALNPGATQQPAFRVFCCAEKISALRGLKPGTDKDVAAASRLRQERSRQGAGNEGRKLCWKKSCSFPVHGVFKA